MVTKPFVNKMKTLNVLSNINADFRAGPMTLVSLAKPLLAACCVKFFGEYATQVDVSVVCLVWPGVRCTWFRKVHALKDHRGPDQGERQCTWCGAALAEGIFSADCQN